MLPERDRELWAAAATDGRRGKAYYDFTFSAPKSVSVYAAALQAAGAHEQAAAVVAAHDEAVRVAIGFAEPRIAYTRTGWHGRSSTGNESVGKHEAGVGTVWTTWRHSSSRKDEPQLHTHAALLNRTVTALGTIGALDGAAFRGVKEAIDTAYTRALEQLVTAATGARFELRGDGVAREIVGVDADLMAEASTRRGQVTVRVGELMDAYRETHGREPGPAARKAMADMAALDTRAAKGPESGPSAVATWSAERVARLVATVDEVAMAGHQPDTATIPDTGDGQAREVTVAGREAVMAAAIDDVQARYAVWTVGNLTAALDARLGDAAALGVPVAERPAVLEDLTRRALRTSEVVLVSAPDPVAVPDELRRADGGSLYRRANGQRYVTASHLATEDRVLAQARGGLGLAIAGPQAELLQVELAAAGLSPDQVAAVAGIVSSGRVGDVLVGPAGAGKSRTVGELARTWTAHTGGRVLGVATSQIATRNLAGDGLEAINSTRFLNAFTPDETGQVRDRLRGGDMVIVDEAGMSSTRDLAAITDLAADAGAKVVYTGDQYQLDAVEAGGLFAHLARTGPAHELAEVHRFHEEWEREASLQIRAGDQAAVDVYGDRARLHTGTIEEMQEAAARAYLADTVAGKESLLIVGSNHDAAALSRAVRERLITLGRVEATPVAELASRQPVSVGDRVQARMNDYQLRVDPAVGDDGRPGPAEPVVNRAVYTVLGRHTGSGALLVRDQHGATAHLLPQYVAEHVSLAYAVTVHAAQGVTVDTGHPIVDRDATREQVYPAATRGREANHLYLVTDRAPDVHEPERVAESARERFCAVLATSTAAQAATWVRQQGIESAESLTMAAAQLDAVAGDYARDRYTATLTALLGDERAAGVQAEAGYGRLLRATREAELAGHNPDTVLTEAVTARGLDTAESVSDVVRWRLRNHVEHREPEQAVDPADWTTLAAPTEGEVGEYLQALAVLAGDRQQLLGRQVADQEPEWATAHLGPVPDHETAERAGWEHRAGIAAAYRELHQIPDEQVSIGAAPSREYEFHRALWGHAREALGRPADVVDPQALPDAALYAMTERWAREQAIAPEWVADQLADAHRGAHEHRISQRLRQAEIDTLPETDPARARLVAERDSLARMVQWHTRRAADLEDGYTRRAEWAASSRDVADDARLAAEELARRGLPAERAGTPEPDNRRVGRDPEHQPEAAQTVGATPDTRDVPQAAVAVGRGRTVEHGRGVEAVEALRETATASTENVAYDRGRTVEQTHSSERVAAAEVEDDRSRRDRGLEHSQERERALAHELAHEHELDYGMDLGL